MGLLDSDVEEPKSKLRRYLVSILVLALLVSVTAWWLLRYHTEKQSVDAFLAALAANDLQRAYQLWKPGPSYRYQDFVSDWGPEGEYGPVKSYRIVRAGKPRNLRGRVVDDASGVVVTVHVSPDAKFPEAERDQAAMRRVKEVRIWVERKDQSLSYPP